ncbi:Peroxisomal acyl-coenzyme A oxidase 1-like 1 [Homarus americanus]|uniref:Peroxisomal acyl-coenzyme A oxidase 1-like 1 n=1 Tax=Homarus americanus TaxID=6706 RepID=A0A8J5JYP6_HOMAM|nr:Peroxisomal acyl-coenzyme A oxidase 1-like 1 [Homarus americanus]
MFIPAIVGQGTSEQQDKWLGRAERAEIVGTYAQTEMGHGTFLRGLETTATYDPASQEFVLHSPTITATKWWPGGLGKTCNYAVVMAQLYTQGQNYGPHPFVVQLRDEYTHRSLLGVMLGEIGPRLGLKANDNGFLRFDHYRIPRMNMLMKHSQVLEDGTYVRPLHSKLSYGTMVQIRVGIVNDAWQNLGRAVTIATRYSAVRHQSEMAPGVTASLEKGNVELLPELHSLSSGLKAMSAEDATLGIEICRLACGGHGYLASSGLPRLYANTTCCITYEGENTVLWLQAHIRYFICKTFVESVESLDASEGVRSVLQSLCRLYLIYYINLKQGEFLRYGALTSKNLAFLEKEMCELLAVLRPRAVSLVDAFDMPDALLNSTLGSWDGNVYQRLFDEALKSPLNKTDVPDAYYKYLRPLMKSNL